MAVFTARRQSLHDMVARTYVVRRQYSAEEIGAAGPAPDAPVWAAILAVCGCLFGGPFGIGILAAIAIPAYQDYTIRAQVMEGLSAASGAKAAIAEALAQGKPLRSINSRTLELPSTDALRYVREISVDDGVVTILYGRAANRALVGERLALIPGRVSMHEDVVWVCGHHEPPPDVTLVTESAGPDTTVAAKYLPRSCRPGGG
jgi:type IV pilus assembly protein PilA